MDAVKKLADGNDTDRDGLIGTDALQRLNAAIAFEFDQNARVDQEGQEDSSVPASLRSAERSAANSASAGGAAARTA